ncbi:MAG: hypothetical protein PW790_12635 [Parvibaculaceae bacterium]|nr:hypothetical protein [Parvibaculaceae bacterium]
MHGIVGGVSSVASGGKFQAGFLAAAISDGASPMQAHTLSQLAMAEAQTAVVGGVGSVLSGGKFSDGAVTGAFGYLFNDCFENCDWSHYQSPDGINAEHTNASSISAYNNNFINDSLEAASASMGVAYGYSGFVAEASCSFGSCYSGIGIGLGEVGFSKGLSVDHVIYTNGPETYGFTRQSTIAFFPFFYGPVLTLSSTNGVDTLSVSMGIGAGAAITSTSGYSWKIK